MAGGRLPRFERVTLAASALTLAVTLASWGLMRFGAYSLGRALGIGAVSALAGVALVWRMSERGAPAEGEPESSRVASIALALCGGFGVLYAVFPTYFLLGGQDPGPYLAFAARVAKTGGLHLEVPAIEAWSRLHGAALVRNFPAVYGSLVEPRGDSPPQAQFLHLFTAYLASFFAAGGVEGAVRANAWLAVLCLATGFAFVRRLASTQAAFGFVVALGVNPAFVWASRITLSEVVALWLNLLGLFVLLVAHDLPSAAVAALGGALLALGILNRFDGGFAAVAILGLAVAALFGAPSRRRVAFAAGVSHLAVSALAYRDAFMLSGYYCHALSEGIARWLPPLTCGLDLAAIALAALPGRAARALRLDEARLRLVAYGAIAVGVCWAFFGLFVRPSMDRGDDAHSLRELTWYVGWACWPLSLGGMALAIRTRSARALPFVAFALASLLAYTARMDVAPYHIWASRRWVPHTIPLLLAGAAIGAVWLVERARSHREAIAVAAGLGALVLTAPLSFDRPFLFHSMFDGLTQAYERVAKYAREQGERLPLVTENVHFGSILSYVYDVPTVVLNDAGVAALERGELGGELAVGLSPLEAHGPLVAGADYPGSYLVHGKEERPSRLVTEHYLLEVCELGPPLFDTEIAASHVTFRTQLSRIARNGNVVSLGRAGRLLWGPGLTLPPGRYRAEWYGRLEARGRRTPPANFQVTAADGERTLTQAPIAVTEAPTQYPELVALDFTLTEPTERIEFRVAVESRVRLALEKLRLRRLDAP